MLTGIIYKMGEHVFVSRVHWVPGSMCLQLFETFFETFWNFLGNFFETFFETFWNFFWNFELSIILIDIDFISKECIRLSS